MESKLHIRITTPREVLYEGEAESISSANVDGPFDILPYHANFITFVQGKEFTIRQKAGGDKKFTFDFAIVYNKDNQVNIYTDIQLPNLETLAD
ncbi:MAG: hypothetical protein Q7S79_03840 [bacterium]|nr:hypothetical protein [bacterium]